MPCHARINCCSSWEGQAVSVNYIPFPWNPTWQCVLFLLQIKLDDSPRSFTTFSKTTIFHRTQLLHQSPMVAPPVPSLAPVPVGSCCPKDALHRIHPKSSLPGKVSPKKHGNILKGWGFTCFFTDDMRWHTVTKLRRKHMCLYIVFWWLCDVHCRSVLT